MRIFCGTLYKHLRILRHSALSYQGQGQCMKMFSKSYNSKSEHVSKLNYSINSELTLTRNL